MWRILPCPAGSGGMCTAHRDAAPIVPPSQPASENQAYAVSSAVHRVRWRTTLRYTAGAGAYSSAGRRAPDPPGYGQAAGELGGARHGAAAVISCRCRPSAARRSCATNSGWGLSRSTGMPNTASAAGSLVAMAASPVSAWPPPLGPHPHPLPVASCRRATSVRCSKLPCRSARRRFQCRLACTSSAPTPAARLSSAAPPRWAWPSADLGGGASGPSGATWLHYCCRRSHRGGHTAAAAATTA